MKSLFVFLLSFLVVFSSCDKKQKKDRSLVPGSVGNINALQVIIPNDLWSGPVGEEIREYFAAPADGLPQDEPLFTIDQIVPETFQDFVRTNRIFLFVNLDPEETATIVKNQYAKPQTGAILKAATEDRLIELIREKSEGIIQSFIESEIKERQKRAAISKRPMDSLISKFGISLEIPTAYRMAASEDSHFWFRKDLKDGEMNILVYEVPLSSIQNDSTAVADIIKIRDSIGAHFIPVEDNEKFVTDDAYSPFIFHTSMDKKFAYETKGIWELDNYHMAGPFLNYAIRDEEKNRYVILEGFVYAPMVRKRNLQFELESILKSVKFE